MNSTIEFISKKFNVDPSVFPVHLAQVNRTIIAQMFNELGFTQGAEIGVAEGTYSQVIFENNPGLKLHLIDVWESYPGYAELNTPEEVYIQTKERLKKYDANFVRKFSMDAVNDFEDKSLDFVFIDGGHDFRNVANDICEWSKKVKPGGIVYGHDYKFHKGYYQRSQHHSPKYRYPVEVKIVVDAYRDARGIRPWFEIYPEIPDPTFGPDNPCWMFVRQEGDRV